MWPRKLQRKATVSTRSGRLVCGCGRGYASENPEHVYVGQCNICYREGLTRRELRELNLKRP